jgi:uncharacterized YigZ family protein
MSLDSGTLKQTIVDTPDAPSSFELIEKKSEFIGQAAHCNNEAEAMVFVESVRQNHPKARHVAFAAIFEAPHGGVGERMSDDGEPSGTAGKPILDALTKSGMSGVVVTVTRYFGGVLLGSAGLIRAYSTAASGALKAARRARVIPHTRCELTVSYPQLGTLDHVLESLSGRVEQRDYSDVVHSVVVIRTSELERFFDRVREAFQGSVTVEAVGDVDIAVEVSPAGTLE